MPLVSNDLANAEVRVRELKAKIALRESQRGLPGQFGGREELHITALRTELASAAAIVIAARYAPLDVLDKMGWK